MLAAARDVMTDKASGRACRCQTGPKMASGTIIKNVDQGTGTIIGGIGKYAGIQGKMAYHCGPPIDPAHGLEACTQQFDYQLK
jgi:hypothetical protein